MAKLVVAVREMARPGGVYALYLECALVGIPGLTAGPALALVDSELSVIAQAGPEQTSRTYYGANIGIAEEDYGFSDSELGSWSGTARGQAGGETSLGVPPTADGQAAVQVSTLPSASYPLTGTAGGGGSYVYEVRVVSTQPSPLVFNPPVHLSVDYNGIAMLQGSPYFSSTPGQSSSAVAIVSIQQQVTGTVFSSETAEATQFQLTDEFAGTRGFAISPGALEYPLTVRVHAGTGVTVVGTATASGQAVADPLFSFDQAAFDEYAALEGFTSFRLEDHFALEYSPGYTVPEPGVAVLSWLGVAGLALLGDRRRKASRAGVR